MWFRNSSKVYSLLLCPPTYLKRLLLSFFESIEREMITSKKESQPPTRYSKAKEAHYAQLLILAMAFAICVGNNRSSTSTMWTKVPAHLDMTPTGAAQSWKPMAWSSWHTVFLLMLKARLELCSYWVSRAMVTFTHGALHSNMTRPATLWMSCCGSWTLLCKNTTYS